MDHQIDLSFKAKTKKEALAHLEEALRIDPTNLDARLVGLEYLADRKEKIEALEGYIQDNYQLLQEQAKKEKVNFNRDYVGHFYGILETRSHMRALNMLAEIYRNEKMTDMAIKTYKEMLRLNPNDNLGARYRPMILYMLTGNEKEMKFLIKNYKEESPGMQLPYLFLLILRKDEDPALKLYRKLQQKNPDFTRIIMARGFREETHDRVFSQGAYRPGTEEEMAQFIIELQEEFIFNPKGYVYRWLYENKNLK